MGIKFGFIYAFLSLREKDTNDSDPSNQVILRKTLKKPKRFKSLSTNSNETTYCEIGRAHV